MLVGVHGGGGLREAGGVQATLESGLLVLSNGRNMVSEQEKSGLTPRFLA